VSVSCGGVAMQLAEAVIDLGETSVGVVKVNAEDAPELKHAHHIQGYPSLKLFTNGIFIEDYTVRVPTRPLRPRVAFGEVGYGSQLC
jgi:hypothetical protein